MDAVGESLVAYLRRGRQPLPHRQIFLGHHAPAGPLKPTAVAEVFQKWVRKSGLNISYKGAHCHTFAVHALLRWYRSGVNVQSKLPDQRQLH